MRKILPDKDTLIKELAILGQQEIADKYNCKLRSLQHKIRLYNIHNIHIPKPYDKFNQSYFDNWSANMAYILGFITADGSIRKKRPYITIELNPKDEHILQEILNEIYPSGKIYKSHKYNKKRDITYYSSSIVFYSQYMKNKLKEYSIFPNKTGKHKIDFNIPLKYQRDYVRGFFDGDGSIYITRDKKYGHDKYMSRFCAKSDIFMHQLHNMIHNLGTLYLDNQNLWIINCAHSDSIKLREYMYYNDCMCLIRKKEKFVCLNQ